MTTDHHHHLSDILPRLRSGHRMRGFHVIVALALATPWLAAASDDAPVPAVPPADSRCDHGPAREANIRLTHAVEVQLLSSPVVLGRQLMVSSHNGVVTLTGTLDSLEASMQAEALARLAPGVLVVENRIQAAPRHRDDVDLLADAQIRFTTDPVLRDLRLLPVVDSGRVVLGGIVPSLVDKQLALAAALSLDGVQEVVDGVLIDDRLPRSDDALRTTILAGIDRCLPLRGTSIVVQISNGQVHLAGVVGSDDERRLAMGIAWASGSVALSEQLRIDGALPSHENFHASSVDPATASGAVGWVLQHDPRLRGTRLTAIVDHGTAMIAGHVGSVDARQAAIEDALGCVAVQRVEDAMTRGALPLDSDAIRQARLQARLERDPLLEDALGVVGVRDGTALVIGAVPDPAVASRITQDVASDPALAGMAEVLIDLPNGARVSDLSGVPLAIPGREPVAEEITRLWLGPLEVRDDATLAQAARQALRLAPITDRQAFSVSVAHGVVTMSGVAGSWSERSVAAQAVAAIAPLWLRTHVAVRPPGVMDQRVDQTTTHLTG